MNYPINLWPICLLSCFSFLVSYKGSLYIMDMRKGQGLFMDDISLFQRRQTEHSPPSKSQLMFEILFVYFPPVFFAFCSCLGTDAHRGYIKHQGKLGPGAKGPSVTAFVGPNVQERTSELMFSRCFLWPADDWAGLNHTISFPTRMAPGPEKTRSHFFGDKQIFQTKFAK